MKQEKEAKQFHYKAYGKRELAQLYIDAGECSYNTFSRWVAKVRKRFPLLFTDSKNAQIFTRKQVEIIIKTIGLPGGYE